MKLSKLTMASLLVSASLSSIGSHADKYDANWESLSKKALPEWVVDAKFGIYTHWGVYSVPAHGGPDYAPNLYSHKRDIKGAYSYHKEKYGTLLYVHQGGILGNETMLPRYERKYGFKA